MSATEAGERLLVRERPVGTIRITAAQHSVDTVIWPKLQPFLKAYADIRVEIAVQYGMTDIAAERFDAGVRLGEQVAKDMVAVRIGPDLRMAVVATPEYFRARSIPKSPQDLIAHNCINLRLSTHGGLYAWEFEKSGREINVRVDGQLVFNGSNHMLQAALAGLGVAYLPEDTVTRHLEQKRLQRVLDDWCAAFPGYHLYYPSRRQASPAFSLLVEALRHRR